MLGGHFKKWNTVNGSVEAKAETVATAILPAVAIIVGFGWLTELLISPLTFSCLWNRPPGGLSSSSPGRLHFIPKCIRTGTNNSRKSINFFCFDYDGESVKQTIVTHFDMNQFYDWLRRKPGFHEPHDTFWHSGKIMIYNMPFVFTRYILI